MAAFVMLSIVIVDYDVVFLRFFSSRNRNAKDDFASIIPTV